MSKQDNKQGAGEQGLEVVALVVSKVKGGTGAGYDAKGFTGWLSKCLALDGKTLADITTEDGIQVTPEQVGFFSHDKQVISKQREKYNGILKAEGVQLSLKKDRGLFVIPAKVGK